MIIYFGEVQLFPERGLVSYLYPTDILLSFSGSTWERYIEALPPILALGAPLDYSR